MMKLKSMPNEEYKKLIKEKQQHCLLAVKGTSLSKLFKDIGIDTILAGYEFAHRDDYEGREILDKIVEDDSKNIESISVDKDQFTIDCFKRAILNFGKINWFKQL